MKSIRLEDKALALATAIHDAHKHHYALHEAWEEKKQREHEELAKNADTEIRGLLTLLSNELNIDPSEAKPQLDLRYIEEHGIAFMVVDDDDEAENNQLATAELEQ